LSLTEAIGWIKRTCVLSHTYIVEGYVEMKIED